MATLSVTHQESITINNTQYGGTNSFSITGINNVIKRVITVAANNDTTLASFHSDQHDDDMTIDVENVKYIRLTNLDGSNLINLNFQLDAGEDDSAADESASFQLLAGQSFIMGDADDCMSVDSSAALSSSPASN